MCLVYVNGSVYWSLGSFLWVEALEYCLRDACDKGGYGKLSQADLWER